MLPDIEFCFSLIILKFSIFQFRFLPIHSQQFVFKICIVSKICFWNIFHQISKFFPYFFKLIDTRIVKIVRMQYLLNQFTLLLNFGNIGYTGNPTHLFAKVSSCFCIFFTYKICKFYPIHKCIKTHRTCFVCIRPYQRSQLFSYH